MAKIILTEEQYNTIIKQITKETLKNVESEDSLNEGVWTNIKKGLSDFEMGVRNRSSKLFGKSKYKEELEFKIEQLLDVNGDKFIKSLDSKIKETNPQFPNNKEPEDFIASLDLIAQTYDSIVEATKKDTNDSEYLNIDAANAIIEKLRDYVTKIIDVDLSFVFKNLDENEENEEYEEEVIDEDISSDARKKFRKDRYVRQSAKGADKSDFKTKSMSAAQRKKVESWLIGIGGALGGLSWLAQTDWFKDWLVETFGGDEVVKTGEVVREINGGDADAKGFLHWANSINEKAGYGEIKTGADVQTFVNNFGEDNVKHMFEGNGGGSMDTQIDQLQQVVGGENTNKPVEQIFTKENNTFGSMKGGQNLFGVSKAASFLATIVIKKGILQTIKGTGTILAAKFSGLASVLGPLGIALVAGGALSLAMKAKAKRSSRLATLNALLQSLRNIPGGVIIEPEKKSEVSGETKPEKNKTTPSDSTDDDLYNSFRELFRYITKNKESFETKSNVNAFGVGDIVTYMASSGNKTKATVAGTTGRPNEYTIISEPNKNQHIIDGDKLTLVKKAKKNLSEGKYIKDENLLKFLNKNLSSERVRGFEKLLFRIEYLRDKIRKIKDGNDKVFNQKIKNMQENPIMLTDFSKMFNLSTRNPQEYQNYVNFVNLIFDKVYKTKYKNGNLVDMFANIEKVNEVSPNNVQFRQDQKQKDGNDRKKFINNLIKFLKDSIELFQYMVKKRNDDKVLQKNTQKPITESINQMDSLFKEELDKMKSLMFRII